MSFEKALNQIADVIDYAKNKIGFECVEYTLEDATSVPFDRMIEVCKTAERAGVDVLRIPDTKGQIEFDDFREMIEKLVKNVDTPIDVHCHNDRGLAVANAIAGLKAGATGVHVSVLGLGERCGITDLVTLVETLESVHHVNTGVNFKKIPSLYDYVSAVSGIAIPPSFPIVGVFARTHKAGTHQKAVLHCPDTYETIDWAKYGLEREYEFGAMQARELTEKLLEGVEVGAEVKEEIDRRIREVSMERGRPLSRAEVWRIAESVGVKLELSYKASFPQDAKIFIKVRPGCDELNLIKNVMKKFLEYKIPAKISVMVGEYDMLVDVRGIKSPQDLDSITREIRRENKDIMETSTSIVLDKYE
jgi:isopropylmalate/homocitrate/citramalate synthase